MKKLISVLLSLCLLVGMCGIAAAEDYAAYIDSLFTWGVSIDDYISVNLITEYETAQLTESITLLHEEYSDTEYEDSIFVQDQYIGGTYDCTEADEEDITSMHLTLESLFGHYTEGGEERVYAIMNTLLPGAYASADSFTDCVYAEIPEKGYFGAICSYQSGSYVFMVINETLLYSLAGAAPEAEAAPAASDSAVGGGLSVGGSLDTGTAAIGTSETAGMFDWGCTAEEYIANNELIEGYQQLDVTDDVSIIIETFSDYEYEGYIFVNDRFAADIYEYGGEPIGPDLMPVFESLFGVPAAGGADRIVAIINAMGGTLDLTADQIIDPHYIDLEDGSAAFIFSYADSGITYSDILAVNEAVLFGAAE